MPSSRAEARPPGSPSSTWSLARRLTFWYLCWFFTLACFVTGFYYWGIVRGFAQVDDDLLQERILDWGRLLSQGKATQALFALEADSGSEVLQNRHFYTRILDKKGNVFIQTAGMAELLPQDALSPAVALGGKGSLLLKGPTGRVFAVMAGTVQGSRPNQEWIVQVAYDRTSLEAALNNHERMMAVVLAAVSLAALLFGYRIVRRGLRPLREMVEASQQIGGSSLKQRVSLKDPAPELALLVQNFNQMLNRLEESFNHVSKFSADIAHELRTPLTNLRGGAEVALSKERSAEYYHEVLVSSLEEYVHLSETIEKLLFLAKADRSEESLERKRVDVGEELASIAGFYEPAATEMNLCIQLAANGDLCMNADPVLVRRAVSNLVSNAIAHTPPGGTVGLAAYKEEAAIRVIVADSGAGIPAEHLPHVFDRFYRVNRTPRGRPGGVGLGLSIVKTIMDLHKGLVEITSAPGRGTCVILEFPLVTRT